MAETLRNVYFCQRCQAVTPHIKTQSSLQDNQLLATGAIWLTICTCGLLFPLAIWAYYAEKAKRSSPWICEKCGLD